MVEFGMIGLQKQCRFSAKLVLGNKPQICNFASEAINMHLCSSKATSILRPIVKELGFVDNSFLLIMVKTIV